jgi:predicted amidohydrolase YtcJ
MSGGQRTDGTGVLYRGGTIRPMDSRLNTTPESGHAAATTVPAIATRSGAILAVGTEETCRRALGLPETAAEEPVDDGVGTGPEIVDLGQHTLVPGFIDTQTHPVAACFARLHLDLSSARTISEVLDALADQAARTSRGDWVTGRRLSPDHLQERRLPTLDELDAVSHGRPLVVMLRDGHTAVGNGVALASAGLNVRRRPPRGGLLGRDAAGRLNGVCHARATGRLMGSVQLPDLTDLIPSAEEIFGEWAGQGITSVTSVLQTDGEGLHGPAGALEAVGMMILGDSMPQASHAVLCGDPDSAVDLRTSSSLHEPDRARVVGGIKLYLDGTLAGRTAALHEPYADRPDCRGLLTMPRDVAATRMETAHLAGFQICVHAAGDAAVDVALDLFEDLLTRHPAEGPPARRHCIEHASVISSGAADRMADLGLVGVVQPPVLASGAWLADRVGPYRLDRTYALRSLVAAGVPVAGSSNAPLESTDVLTGIAAAVNREGLPPDQALTTAEALASYTCDAALVQGRHQEAGRLAEGLRADLAVLSDDPLAVTPDARAGIEVRRTVIGGQVVHDLL